MAIVDNDVALLDHPQPRGVAGTLCEQKIAGALAEKGADLDTSSAAPARGPITTIRGPRPCPRVFDMLAAT